MFTMSVEWRHSSGIFIYRPDDANVSGIVNVSKSSALSVKEQWKRFLAMPIKNEPGRQIVPMDKLPVISEKPNLKKTNNYLLINIFFRNIIIITEAQAS